jgi:hypothetical protein
VVLLDENLVVMLFKKQPTQTIKKIVKSNGMDLIRGFF